MNDRSALAAALPGVDTIVHLAGIPTEDEWDTLVAANVTGTKNLFEAAVAARVRRVVQASSIHAVGRVPEEGTAPASVPGDRLPRPDLYYGFTKAAMELLGSLFADRYDMSVVSARIGAFGERPSSRRALLMWSSPDDLARLVQATVDLREPGHHVVWAVSRNTGSPADLSAGEAIGFHPADDASAVLDADQRAALPGGGHPVPRRRHGGPAARSSVELTTGPPGTRRTRTAPPAATTRRTRTAPPG